MNYYFYLNIALIATYYIISWDFYLKNFALQYYNLDSYYIIIFLTIPIIKGQYISFPNIKSKQSIQVMYIIVNIMIFLFCLTIS